MENFIYRNPTEILFGKGMIAEIASRVPADRPVLMVWGGGSIKKNGVYEQVKAALARHKLVEFGGIEPNPLHETCMKALAVVKDKGIKFLLAVGGGSVLDAAKYVAAAAVFPGVDPWDILRTNGSTVTGALPVGAVLTLPATGSESNGNAVISRKSSSEKLHFASDHVYPVFSVLDPETTFSLPAKQVRNGIVDAFVHVCEQYMTLPAQSLLQDRLAESVLQTLVDVGPRTLESPRDYASRADFMWSATIALNNLLSCGVPGDWATHMIGHELTAFYGIDHAESLAVVMPGVWTYKLAAKSAKLAQYGRRIWNVGDAKAAVDKTEAFFHSLNMPTRLKDFGIDAEDAARKVGERFASRKSAFGEQGDITADAAAKILRARA
ncbi:MAG: iron-containing alcohol dehydrogenase [Polyangia bacterium]|jgi:NADP-dependent alcohol dehydrogenase